MDDILGCTPLKYQELTEKVDIKTIYNFIKKYGSGAVSLCQYADDRGRFIPSKYNQDLIAKVIMDSLVSKQKMQVLQYLEDLDERKF